MTSLQSYLCVTCGTAYPESAEPPPSCLICNDERQYVGLSGQQWTTLEQLRNSGRQNQLHPRETGLTAILTEPGFAINQRAFLLETPGGNILWDCIALIDASVRAWIGQRGGLAAIAISHPHYYTTMRQWSRSFGVPVYLHADDKEWVVDSGEHLHFWTGERLHLHDGISIIRCGGHFEGGAVLHWPAGAEGRGVLLSGDIIQVVPDRRWVSFMRSYPNLIPLGPAAIQRILEAVEPFEFDRVYGAFHPMDLIGDGKAAVRRSGERYLRAIAH